MTASDPKARVGLGDLHICSVAGSWVSALRMVETLRRSGEPGPVTLLCLERPSRPPDLPGVTVRTPEDLGLEHDELAELELVYTRQELLGALVPRLLRRLLAGAETGGAVLHLGCQTELHGSLDGIRSALIEHPLVLVPRSSRPVPRDGLAPDEPSLLLGGQFATNEIAVRTDAADAIRWWVDRTRWDAIMDPSAGLAGAGRWLDLMVSLFGAQTLRSPGLGVSAWTLSSAEIAGDGAWTLDGSPLTTIDLSGFEPEQPWLLDTELGTRPRVLLSDHPALERLLEERASALAAISATSPEPPRTPEPPWLDLRVRRMALSALRQAHDRDQDPPFSLTDDHASLIKWLNDLVAYPGVPVSRLLHAVWAGRPDLQAAFRQPLGRDGAALVAWAAGDPAHQRAYGEIDHPVVPRTTLRVDPAPGLNVVGYLHAELGLGEAARLLTRALAVSGVPFAPVAFRETDSLQRVEFAGTIDGAPYDTTLLCVNADLTPLASAKSWGALGEDRHRIGYWFWEVDQMPADQLDALHYVDELWVATRYVADVLRTVTDKQITIVPHPVAEPVTTHLTRADLGLPDRFTFAFWFDAFSSVERKNPAALIRAFCAAFAPDEGPVLFVKSINGHHDRAALEELHWLARGRDDIILSDRYLTGIEMRALVQHVDCYVSLHRSEGFGQTLAEAMMCAKPVIATGHSGNTHFMSDQNSLLVPFELGPVGPGCPPYPADARWARPDTECAATLMRWVVENPVEASALGARAASDIRRTNGIPVVASQLLAVFQRLLEPNAHA